MMVYDAFRWEQPHTVPVSLLPRYKCRCCRGSEAFSQGLKGLLATVRVSPNNRSRLRKRPFAYTQKLSPDFFQGHCWGIVGAQFLANRAPEKCLCIKGIPEIGAHGAMFFRVTSSGHSDWAKQKRLTVYHVSPRVSCLTG